MIPSSFGLEDATTYQKENTISCNVKKNKVIGFNIVSLADSIDYSLLPFSIKLEKNILEE